jgi:hypothetical protein
MSPRQASDGETNLPAEKIGVILNEAVLQAEGRISCHQKCCRQP